MVFVKKVIVVEDKIQSVINLLPTFENPTTLESFSCTFKKGEEKEIDAFLAKSNQPYPLIWLPYGFKEHHNLNNVKITGLSLIVAVQGDKTTFIDDRFENVYKKVLLKIFENIKYLFDKSSSVKITSDYELEKFPNYVKLTSRGKDSQFIDIWDAIKITFDCTITSKC
jgi:hypothetical protein